MTEKDLVHALRSGIYPQGCRALRTGDSNFCCLGVACDISRKGTWTQTKHGAEFLYVIESSDTIESEGQLLPEIIRRELGWATREGTLTFLERDGDETNLAILNDAEFTFSQIADLIDAGLVEVV